MQNSYHLLKSVKIRDILFFLNNFIWIDGDRFSGIVCFVDANETICALKHV